MSLIPQPIAHGSLPEPEHPRLLQRPHSVAEARARWEVRAAQWRARAIAEAVFGRVGESSLVSIRPRGQLRGLLRLEVPFDDLGAHQEREARFVAAVEADPVLSRVPLVFVVMPGLG
jgi:hypothetical protein